MRPGQIGRPGFCVTESRFKGVLEQNESQILDSEEEGEGSHFHKQRRYLPPTPQASGLVGSLLVWPSFSWK